MKKLLIGLFVFVSLPLLIVTETVSILCSTLRFILYWVEFAMDWLFNWYKGIVDNQLCKKEE